MGKKPVEIEKPDLPEGNVLQPAERDAEPPQIKGPDERKEEEVVQLDRPDAGKKQTVKLTWISSRIESLTSVHSAVAVPEGEDHRHEPPIPEDEVRVDSGKNNVKPEEEKKQAEEDVKEEPQRKELGPAPKAEDRKDENVEAKPAGAAEGKEKEGKVGGQVASNEVLEKHVRELGKQDSAPLQDADKPVRDAPNKDADVAANQAVARNEEGGKQANNAEKGKYFNRSL